MVFVGSVDVGAGCKVNMKKVISIVGIRPQYIKLRALSDKLDVRFDHKVIDVGQHYDPCLRAELCAELNMPDPDFFLDCRSGSHAETTGMAMVEIERVLMMERPHAVVVYGDGNSTLAAALAAAKLCIPVFHVEGGCRRRTKEAEEINRVLTDTMSVMNYAPNYLAYKNLLDAGLPGCLTGDLHYELLQHCGSLIDDHAAKGQANQFLYVTLHRPENVDSFQRMEKVLQVLREIQGKDLSVVFSMHPRTKMALKRYGLYESFESSFFVIPPQTYISNLALMKYAHSVLTDSGGMPKEAIALGTRALCLLDSIVWPETLEWGNSLVKLDVLSITNAMHVPVSFPGFIWPKGDVPSQVIVDDMMEHICGF